MKLSPTEIFNGKRILFIGGTGFVGKVTLSMLLYNFPNIGKVYATVRARNIEYLISYLLQMQRITYIHLNEITYLIV